MHKNLNFGKNKSKNKCNKISCEKFYKKIPGIKIKLKNVNFW